MLAHARIELKGSRLSADDRLSAPASARAAITARDVRPDPAWPESMREWRDLRVSWLRQTGFGTGRVRQCCRLSACSPIGRLAYFDDLARQLVKPLRDAAGQWLALTLDHEEPVATAIDALEAHVRSGWDDARLLVRLVRAGDQLEGAADHAVRRGRYSRSLLLAAALCAGCCVAARRYARR